MSDDVLLLVGWLICAAIYGAAVVRIAPHLPVDHELLDKVQEQAVMVLP